MSSRKIILEKVMADRLETMGEEPGLETLLEWRQGSLAEAEREALLERAAVDPAFARQLLDVLDFPELPAEEPWDEGTRDRKWHRFTERLEAEGIRQPESAAPVEAPLTFPSRGLGGSSWLRLAASLLIGVLLGATLYRLVDAPPPLAPPMRNIESWTLSFDDAAMSRGGAMDIRASAEWVQLVFSAADLPAAESYGLRVLDNGGHEVHRQGGLVPGTGARLTALLPAAHLPAGAYRALIYPSGDFGAEAVASATLIVTLESP